MNIHDAIVEIQQPRSRYQLIHFVIGQHDTPEMRFYQLMLELQDMGYKLRLAELGVRKSEVEIARLLETGDELDAIEAEEKQVGLGHTRVVMLGAERELAVLTELFEESTHYTRAEIDADQDAYWKARLTRQTDLQLMSGSVGWAQLDAMRQAGLLDQAIENRHAQLSNGHQEIGP